MKCLIEGCKKEAVSYGAGERGHCDNHAIVSRGSMKAAEMRLEREWAESETNYYRQMVAHIEG